MGRNVPFIDFSENGDLSMLRTDRDIMLGVDENGTVPEIQDEDAEETQ
jgi:hypothetical protein